MRRTFGRRDGAADLHATVEVRSPRLYRSLLLGGATGAGEAYGRGEWDASDPAAVVEIFARASTVLEAMERGAGAVRNTIEYLGRPGRRNSRRGSRRNIAAHYDLGNEFFALFLDDSLTYSSALFDPPELDLASAQTAKLERLCQRLEIGPGRRVLEIGSGWGSFALHAARRHGAHVTTATISRRQFEHVSRLVADHSLAERVRPVLEDYRDLDGAYDALVSIEMIEAVGAEYYDTYFRTCEARLVPGGRLGLQAILIEDDAFEPARRRMDFIKKHIFPGSCIPSLAALRASVRRATSLVEQDLYDLTDHYAQTLRLWRTRLREQWDAAAALGLDEKMLRHWEYYLAYCEGGFRARKIRVAQIVLERRGVGA